MNTKETRDSRRILVYFKNGIGNFIMLTPFLKALSSICYGFPIHILLDPTWERNEYIKNICYNWSLIDDVLIPQESRKINWSDFRYFVNTFSEDSEVRRFMLTQVDDIGSRLIDINKVPWDYKKLTEIERNMLALEEHFGWLMKYNRSIPHPHMPTQEYRHKKPPQGSYITISNASHTDERWEKKKIPWGFLQEICFWFLNNYKYDIMFVGGMEDISFVNDLLKSLGPKYSYRIHNKCGHISVCQTAALVRDSKLCITTDSSVMHIASAVYIKVIALFGPTLETKNPPWPVGEHKILRSGVCPYNMPKGCYPGPYWVRCKDNVCMQQEFSFGITNAIKEMMLL